MWSTSVRPFLFIFSRRRNKKKGILEQKTTVVLVYVFFILFSLCAPPLSALVSVDGREL